MEVSSGKVLIEDSVACINKVVCGRLMTKRKTKYCV